MTEKDIDRLAEAIANKMSEKTKRDCYKETEAALRAYPGWKLSVRKNLERIEEIEKNGLEGIKKNETKERVKGGVIEYKGIPEKEIERIEHLLSENLNLEKRIIRIDNALMHIQDEAFKEIIELRYFKNWTIEEIAVELDTNEKRITRRRNKLVNKIANALYPEFIFG